MTALSYNKQAYSFAPSSYSLAEAPQVSALPQVQGSVSAVVELGKHQARAQMREIERLQHNWDGYGTEPASRSARRNAWHALEYFLSHGPAPEVTPNTNGTISLEWETGAARAHCQVGDTRYSMYVERDGHTPQYFAGEIDDLGAPEAQALEAAFNLRGRRSTPVTHFHYTTSRV